MPRRSNSKTRAAVKKLPWPKALLVNDPLTIRDAFGAGRIIATKLRSGGARFADVSIVEVADVLGASKATVYRAVKVYEVATQYGLEKRLDKVSPTLLHNVERLPERQRKSFLLKAIREGWSKREIVRQVAGEGGRPAGAGAAAQLVNSLRAASKISLDAKGSAELKGKERTEARRLVKVLSARLAKVADGLS